MGILVGYRVQRHDGAFGIVRDVRPIAGGDEPCFATVQWPDGRKEELLRDLRSAPPDEAEQMDL